MSRTQEHSPVLRVFGEHATKLAALLRCRPSLAQRLVFAPTRAVHATGAWLHLHPDADQPDSVVASILEDTDPRNLLRAAIPNAPLRLYRALDRAGETVQHRSYYERIATICAGPLCDDLLSAADISMRVVIRMETLLRCDPAVRRIPGLAKRSDYEIESLDTVLRYLRAHGALRDADLTFPPGAGPKAANRCIQRLFDRLEAQGERLSLPPPFRQVRSVGELRAAGFALKNCVRASRFGGTDHWFDLVAGSALYVTSDNPRLLAAIPKIGSNLWLIEEIAGPENAAIDHETKERLAAALTEAGLVLLPNRPSYALAQIMHRNVLDDLEVEPDFEIEPC